jgi:hypothetical protein
VWVVVGRRVCVGVLWCGISRCCIFRLWAGTGTTQAPKRPTHTITASPPPLKQENNNQQQQEEKKRIFQEKKRKSLTGPDAYII